MIKEGTAHHPHSLLDPKPIADFIEQSFQPATSTRPDFLDDTFTKSYYYSTENSYIYLPKEDTYATCRDRSLPLATTATTKLAGGLAPTAWRCSCRRWRLRGRLGCCGRTALATMLPPLIWLCWPRDIISWPAPHGADRPHPGRLGRSV